MNANRLFAIAAALMLLSAPAAAQKPTPTPRPAPAPVLPKGIDGFEGHLQLDWSKAPRDKAGRPVGFGNRPLMNYSPTMITGKPCPRVTRWGTRAIDAEQPTLRTVDNPCVIQNLIDDVAPALWFFPSGWDTETYKKVVRPLVQRNDPLFRNGVLWANQKDMGFSVSQRWQNWRYLVCDKPVYLLVDLDQRQMLDQRGNLNGDVFRVWFFVTTPDFSPFTCRSYSHKDGTLAFENKMTEAEINGSPPEWVTIPYTILYRDGRWRIGGVEKYGRYELKSYKEFLQRLMPRG